MIIEAVRLDLGVVFAPDNIMWPIVALIDIDGHMTENPKDAVAFVCDTGMGQFTAYVADVNIPTIH